ncbi:MAG: squalene/phytoene synthase family protein [Steroidobacteraceae bacterium]
MKLDASLIARAVPPGSMRYYAWLYTPTAHRDVITALFLLEAELHDTARAPHEVAHTRLQWWREEIEQLILGKARHPATQVLQAANNLNAINFEPLRETLLSAAQELANATYETDVELSQYLRGGLGGLFAVAAQTLSASNSEIIDTAVQLGAFVRQVEITRDLRQDFHQGRLYLPLTTLDALNIEYETLQADNWPDTFVQLLTSRSKQQLTAYNTLKQSLLSSEKQSLRPLLVLTELHARLLHTLATDPTKHTQSRVELGPMQKLWTAWKAARFSV